MTVKELNKSIYFTIIVILLILGIFFKNYRIFLFSNGVIAEDEITFGLTKLLNIENAPFYELNLFYTLILISIVVFIISRLEERANELNKSFNKIKIISTFLFLIILIILTINFEEIRSIDSELKPYSDRLLSVLDDSVRTTKRIAINLSTLEFRIILYSFLLYVILILLIIFSEREIEKNIKLIDD